MKVRGYQIVQVVPATPDRPATPTDPQDWRMRPAPESLPVAARPKLPTFAFAEAERLVTSPSDFSTPEGKLLLSKETFDKLKRPIQSTAAETEAWPSPGVIAVKSYAATLPAPSESLFELPEKSQATLPQRLVVAHAGEGTPSTTPPATSSSARASSPTRPLTVSQPRYRGRTPLVHTARQGARPWHSRKAAPTGQPDAEKHGPHRQVKLAILRKHER
jgi:hypothetical protein